MKKIKKKGKFHRIDKYLYKNSYLYKMGKKILKTKIGKIVSSLILIYFVSVFAINTYYKHEVSAFLKKWETFQHNGNYSDFISSVDMSEKNVYRASFPEWKELFFEERIELELRNISVTIEKNSSYRVKLLVLFKKNGVVLNRFTGDIFIKKKKGKFIIYRLRT